MLWEELFIYFFDKFSLFSWVIDILRAMTNYVKKFQSSKKSRLLFYFDKFINLVNKRIRSKCFFIGTRNGKNWFMINTSTTTKYFLFQRLWPTLRQTSTNVVFGMQIASFLLDVAKNEKKEIFFVIEIQQKKSDWQGKWNCCSSFYDEAPFCDLFENSKLRPFISNVVRGYYILSWFINMKQRNSFDNIYLFGLRKVKKGFIFHFFFLVLYFTFTAGIFFS